MLKLTVELFRTGRLPYTESCILRETDKSLVGTAVIIHMALTGAWIINMKMEEIV